MRTILVGAALVALAASASAQDKRPDYGTAIEAAAAKKIAAGALAECQKNGWNVAVAVVDTHGFLVYFERMENTQTASVDIASGKAKAAATYRRTTRVFMDAINKGGPATATLGGQGVINATGNAIGFVYYGLPSNTALGFSGKTAERQGKRRLLAASKNLSALIAA